ncbi:DUF86 domain-containing protein [Bacillus solimangrovi]|uniref:DUF86 domain-containing protein n=1 Tax=Bacillus solimangrovi TaxID=1305675 RepID=A0A1E5LIR4_9BACI|nr:DUF86 domain-containing protein [Bacillus solimangrovi]OEH93973.1 hypothetical protein BFG57_10015 [Bacillus solimangrovi]
MYFVDRDQIEAKLFYLEELSQWLKEERNFEQITEKIALERVAHMTIEAIIDVGNAMIDGFIMRDPGSYDDVIDIMLDEKVIDNEDERVFKQFITYRKMLVQHYLDINHEQLRSVFQTEAERLPNFAQKVRRYLEEELGPVSAFKP